MPLRDLFAFRRVLSELFGSGLHVRPPSHRCGRRNAEKFTSPVTGVTASPMIQPISERFRTRKGSRRYAAVMMLRYARGVKLLRSGVRRATWVVSWLGWRSRVSQHHMVERGLGVL